MNHEKYEYTYSQSGGKSGKMMKSNCSLGKHKEFENHRKIRENSKFENKIKIALRFQ